MNGVAAVESNALMENVVRLAEFRKRRKHLRRDRAAGDSAPQYFCMRCDMDEFRLYASGMVHCAHCGALMRNLLVSSSPSPSEAG